MIFCEDCKTCNNWVKDACIDAPTIKCECWEEKEVETEAHCNFCGRSKSDIEQAEEAMVGTAGTYICEVCVLNCEKVIGYGKIGIKV